MRAISRFGQGAWIVVLTGLSAVGAHTAEAKDARPFVPEFEFPAPLHTAVAAAAKDGVALEGLDLAFEGASSLKPGDRVTALASLLKGNDLTQWVIEVSCAELTAEEDHAPPLRTWKFYTNTGTEIFLSSTRAALAVRVLGPFDRASRQIDADGDAPEHRARVIVNADFLSLGLDRACEAVMAVNAAKRIDPSLTPVQWGVRLRPYSAEETEKGRKVALALGLTPERERAQVGAAPALLEFFHIIRRTPGLQDILRSVIDIPWWTVIKDGGKAPIALTPQYRLIEELPAGTPLLAGMGGRAYTVPILLFIGGKPALASRLAVVNPRGPLQACAGILGLAACAPDGTGPRVMLQVVSARLGKEKMDKPAGP
jgi:hypothetical protein